MPTLPGVFYTIKAIAAFQVVVMLCSLEVRQVWLILLWINMWVAGRSLVNTCHI